MTERPFLRLRALASPSSLASAGLLLGLPLVGGCAPCDAWCDDVASAYEQCLGEWGLTWAMVGAPDGPEAYADQCREREEEARAGLSAEERATREEQCGAFSSAWSGAETCEEILQVFEGHGVVF